MELACSGSSVAWVSPMWVLRRYRLLETAEAVREGAEVSWAELAADLGYADQAHLIRDFRSALGQTPAAYAAAQAAHLPAPGAQWLRPTARRPGDHRRPPAPGASARGARDPCPARPGWARELVASAQACDAALRSCNRMASAGIGTMTKARSAPPRWI
ncbi:MAG: helix-turn-helix domain-containing protein [Candidatus Dormibacteria bacterium]